MGYAASRKRPLDWWWLTTTSLLVSYCMVFAWAHFHRWLETGRPAGLGLMSLELVTATLFLVRRRPLGTSHSPLAWIATAIGAFGIVAVLKIQRCITRPSML